MTQVAAMAAAITTLQTQLGNAAPSQEQIASEIHTLLDPQVAKLNDLVTKVENDEADYEDLSAAVSEFTTAFAPAAAPAPTPAPESAPESAPAGASN